VLMADKTPEEVLEARSHVVKAWFEAQASECLEQAIGALDARLTNMGFVFVGDDTEASRLAYKFENNVLLMMCQWQHPDGGKPFKVWAQLKVGLHNDNLGRIHFQMGLMCDRVTAQAPEAKLFEGRVRTEWAGVTFEQMVEDSHSKGVWEPWNILGEQQRLQRYPELLNKQLHDYVTWRLPTEAEAVVASLDRIVSV
jgi:hypothetical protein